MLPVINIGPIAIQSTGFILLLGYFIGSWLTSKFAQNIGTNTDVIENCILISLLLGLVGARAGFLLQNPTVLVNNPLSLVSLTPSMLNTGFGLLVGGLSAIVIAQKNNLPLWPTLDTISPFFLVIFASIHLANFGSGKDFGLATNLPWGIHLWNASRHPVQIYALLLVVCLFLWFLLHTKGLMTNGYVRSGVLFNLILASLGFITLFTRAFIENKVLLAGIDVIQLISFIILALSLGIIYQKVYRPPERNAVLISMGSNIDSQQNLVKGLESLKTEFGVNKSSSIYRSRDINKHSGKVEYLNQLVNFSTSMSYKEVIEKLKSIEKASGRQPGDKHSVPLDLDLLTYNNDVFHVQDQHGLQYVPHPDLLRHRHIVLPLAEISPGFKHPANGLSIQGIMKNIKDNRKIIKMKEVTHHGSTR